MESTKTFPARLLYFVLHLFSRAHLSLVAGALVTALTYSGEATIHTILTAPCPITVSLLNWSDVLRQLGQKAASMEEDRKAEKTTSRRRDKDHCQLRRMAGRTAASGER